MIALLSSAPAGRCCHSTAIAAAPRCACHHVRPTTASAAVEPA